jgi:hypothetical protein
VSPKMPLFEDVDCPLAHHFLSSFRSGFDAMLVLEHSPVYTLGRSAKPGDVKFPLVEGTGQGGRGFEVRRERGVHRQRRAIPCIA